MPDSPTRESSDDEPPREQIGDQGTGAQGAGDQKLSDQRAAEGEEVATAGAELDEGPSEFEEGPGWLPAILAGSLLMGILGFLFCALSTWVLFQQRTEFAIRTLNGSYLPELKQSLLEPEDKQAVIARIETLVKELEGGMYEQWQAAGVMQRLQRLPVLQWGELAAVEGYANKVGGDQAERAELQFSRLRRAVEKGKVTSFDFEDVLKPVLVSDEDSSTGRRLTQPLSEQAVDEVIVRAKLVADRSEIPEKPFDVDLDPILRGEIEAGLSDGGF